MRIHARRLAIPIVLVGLAAPVLVRATARLGAATSTPVAQASKKPVPVPGQMLEQGTISLDTPDFELTLVRSSQTVAALRPKRADRFDFTPGDLLVERSQNGYYHLGDLDLRLRVGGAGEWMNYSTAHARTPLAALPVSPTSIAAADLTPTLPADVPLRITRTWMVDNGTLVLRFQLTNRVAEPVQIGALGLAMVFNNVLTDRSLDEAHAACVFYDPYLGVDAGYLQVTRLSGQGPALIVVPDGRTPFEAYNPILNPPRPGTGAPTIFTDLTRRGQTFEGFFDWMVHSQAYAGKEWKGVTPWNPPTSATLKPGESRSYGVRFLLADEIRRIESALVASGRPVAVGIPGYVLPRDLDARLFLKYPKAVASIEVEPREAIAITKAPATRGGWQAWTLRGRTWGRARLSVLYKDGTRQAVHYFVTKPMAEAADDLGRFLTTRQWFVDPSDPFRRSPSVMTYDRDENRIVTQDSRVWVAGLGDEGGSSWLTGAMKQLGRPDKPEIDKYQEFVDRVVWGGLQYIDGPKQYGVRKSLFYYQPDQMPAGYYRADLNWNTWTSWNKAASEAVDRSYDYPHVAALYWTMYRLARNRAGLVTNHPWEWYLANACRTTLAMMKHAPHYAQFGQMEGTVFLEILKDLKREGWISQAAEVESAMRARTAVWTRLAYPFGSEMPWDSTGQEEVYAWTKYFGDAAKANVTLNAILGYMPTLPAWGYNGCARRYWDFLYGGKIRRIERQLHHYGSGLNALPVLSEYRDHPADLYLLRVGYGGVMGAIASIDEEGFASAAFHSFPDTLRWDPLSGDYAQNFLGHALNAATYLVNDPEFGWQAFGGNLNATGRRVALTPLDVFRTRVYLAPIGLWLTLDAGQFACVELDGASRTVRVGLAPATPFASSARLRIEQPATVSGVGTYAPTRAFSIEREAHVVPLATAVTWVELRAARNQ
jgi:hypothetical protein